MMKRTSLIFLCILLIQQSGFGQSSNATFTVLHRLDSTCLTGSRRDIYLYDNQNKNMERIVYLDHPITQEWMKSGRTTYEYDSSGNLIMQTEYSADYPFTAWSPSRRYDYFNGAQGLDTSKITYFWNSSSTSWKLISKSTSVYNASGQRTSSKGLRWNSLTQQWYLTGKVENTLNSHGLVTQSLSELWDSTTSTWKPFDRYMYFYNSSDQLVQENYAIWEGLYPNTWAYEYQFINAWDLNGDLIEMFAYQWMPPWEEYFRGLNYYNLSYSADDFILPVNYLSIEYNIATASYFYNSHPIMYSVDFVPDNNGGYFPTGDSSLYYYSDVIVGYPERMPQHALRLYPNPNNGLMKIEGFREQFPVPCKVFDMQGKLVMNFVAEFDQIDLRELPKGVYVLVVQMLNEPFHLKFIRS